MNKIYKVVWNKARNCYVVGSEFISSHSTGKTSTVGSKSVKILLAAVALATVQWSGAVWAADTASGTGNGVAIGTGSKAPKAENVAIGKDAKISYSNGEKNATGDIAIGAGADVNNYASQGGSIAIGKNAKVENMAGGGEASFAFGQTTYSGNLFPSSRIPADPAKVVGSIAIGDNTFARTGSTMIGSHNYKGELGDTTVDSSSTRTDALNVYATTIGANSFSNGAFTTSTGVYNIISSEYNGGRFANPVKNLGATITGALNSIESKTGGYYSGIANTVSGIANRTSNSNGSLIYGAGNEITNSITSLSNVPTDSGSSAKAFAEKLRTTITNNEGGGATLAIGGGNKADYTQKTSIIGVNNKVTGTKDAVSAYNFVNGFKNTVKKASHVTVSGSENQISGAVNGGTTEKDIVLGDNNVLHDMQNSIVLGNNKQLSYMKGVIAIGDDGDLRTADNSVAIGQNVSIWRSNGDKGITGNVAIGENAFINSYFSQGDSVAIGKNSTVINMGGSQEKAFAFGKKDEKDYAGAIAIGENTYARSGSTMIGVHDYTGALGDLTIQFNKKNEGTAGINDYQQGMNTTTVGNNSYNNGAFSTVMGSYTAVSGEYHSDKWIDKPYGVQNFGAAVIGSLNSIESKTSDNNTAGMADSILGSGNRTHNANGTVMIGAGNVVTDSIVDFDATKIKSGVANANELSSALRESVNQANGGGAVSIIGNANEVSKATHVTVLGTQNKVQNSNNQVIGDKHTITGANNVILGSADQEMNTSVNDSVIMGHNANVTVDGGVAIGTNSRADRVAGSEKDVAGAFAPDTISDTQKSTWTSTAGAVSVGDTVRNITRQITNVAAGSEDTDAVNVAQLKQVKDSVAVIYDKNKSLRSTNAGVVGLSSIALGDEATTGWLSIALGDKTKATGEDATAIGYQAEATALDSIAIGGNAKSTGGDSIAIGNDTNATSLYSVAIGDDIHFTGNSATAVGQQAHATGDYSTALGAMTNVDDEYNRSHKAWRKSGVQSTAIGYHSGSWGDYSTALGAFAKTENQFSSAIGYNSQATAQNAVALGAAAKANVYGGVALGTLSVADKEKGVKGAFAPEKINATDQSTWISTAGAVSVGDTEKNITRQITHVAAGREDTDAVNVAQLKQVNDNLTNQISQSKITVSAGKNINVMSKDNGYTVSLNDVVKLGNDKIILDGTTGTIHTTTAGTGVGSENTLDFNENGLVITNNNTGTTTVSGGTLTIDGKLLGGQSTISGSNAQFGNVHINNSAMISTITGLTNTTTDDAGFATSGRAATEEQLKQVKDTANRAKTTVVAGKNIKVDADTKDDGHTEYNVSLDDDITLGNNASDNFVTVSGTKGTIWASHSISAGNVIMDGDSGTITGLTNTTWNGTTNDASRAATEGQLQQVTSAVTSNDKRLVQNPNGGDGSYQVKENGDVTLRVEDSNKNGYNVTIKDVASKAELDKVKSDMGNVDGFHDDIKNKDENGNPIHTSVVDAVNNLDNKVDKIQADVTNATEEAKKHSSVSTTDSNLSISEGTNAAGGTDYKLSLNKELNLDSVITGDTKMDTKGVTVGDKVSLTKDGLTAGDTKVTNDGISIGDKTYVSKDGLNANNQTITNVADGKVEKGSTDAVNGGQLYETNQAIANNATNISSLSHSLSNLDNRVNKVGAGAAALAALHPLDFDPDAKWDFAAGYGNYRGTNAAAVGAYYRPNEDTMFSIGGTFGNGENMVNAGVSFKLGAGSSHVSTSRVAMAKEIKELRSELEAMKSAMLDANAGKKVDTSKLQLFPDVPQNHWAYEYVAQLAGNGMIEGYPDGNFAGDRPMTRYEFAAMLYRAMTKGAVLSDKILNEFSHELEYFTVDTVAKDKAGNPTIQRVRTVKANKNK